ncbi:MAG: hypothetical protein HYT20_03885, partial [Candidatus Nealsonbacteria bacterium]|nr:hypothetical protein [Candidatus Nealsonbacteria bacterium]
MIGLGGVREGSLDPDEVVRAVQEIIDHHFYLKKIKVDIFNAYLGDSDGIRKGVLAYVDMVIGMNSITKSLFGPLWHDPTSGRVASVSRIDENYINSVEARLGLVNKEMKEDFRCVIRRNYAQKRDTNPNYDFMDNQDLVAAVTDVRLSAEIVKADSLV